LGAEADVAGIAPPRAAVLWIGILTGPTAWAVDLVLRYALVHWSCAARQTGVLKLISIATLLVVVAAGVIAGQAFRNTPSRAPTDGGRSIDRGRFMAMLGILTSLLFALVVVAGAVPQWVLDACD
jgi:hypothetical protein